VLSKPAKIPLTRNLPRQTKKHDVATLTVLEGYDPRMVPVVSQLSGFELCFHNMSVEISSYARRIMVLYSSAVSTVTFASGRTKITIEGFFIDAARVTFTIWGDQIPAVETFFGYEALSLL
jgi:hypothetical protein